MLSEPVLVYGLLGMGGPTLRMHESGVRPKIIDWTVDSKAYQWTLHILHNGPAFWTCKKKEK